MYTIILATLIILCRFASAIGENTSKLSVRKENFNIRRARPTPESRAFSKRSIDYSIVASFKAQQTIRGHAVVLKSDSHRFVFTALEATDEHRPAHVSFEITSGSTDSSNENPAGANEIWVTVGWSERPQAVSKQVEGWPRRCCLADIDITFSVAVKINSARTTSKLKLLCGPIYALTYGDPACEPAIETDVPAGSIKHKIQNTYG
ncbi:uncharacterized protein L969DRAFT_46372 [Mixia osmundae IAM 14324]|uniref:uncharacterized protein n=1 Tax=Mixia osmundae (strain CBS 9802 / IAM 14324 / JCM 22182 / KY 12970) TaxID=764103 RepID=UPI0004A54AAF|nr:uncharacterized protein L969DRAFT_46372 [Mixia osmundae IAM 14324]KEI41085.1 hypothetical protein L969DRAFT_46372 [Mixia osmundae IAM 14324]